MANSVSNRRMERSQPRTGRPLAVGWAAPTEFHVPIPKDEKQRLAALHSYKVLDTPPEADFDALTALIAQICHVPIAMITLVDENRQWFKSRVGIKLSETPRSVAFCAHTIMQRDILIVPDAAADPRFAANPLVVGGPKIRFYAGVPLITREDRALGTLCVVDKIPRQLSAPQRTALETLARQVMAQMELRRELGRSREHMLEARLEQRTLHRQIERLENAAAHHEAWLSHLAREVKAAARDTGKQVHLVFGRPQTAQRRLQQVARRLEGLARELPGKH